MSSAPMTSDKAARASDDLILHYCIAAHRILVTLDDDFGNWAVLPLGEHPGVIRIKAHPPTTQNISDVFLPLIGRHSPDDFRDRLVIASELKTRWVRTGRAE